MAIARNHPAQPVVPWRSARLDRLLGSSRRSSGRSCPPSTPRRCRPCRPFRGDYARRDTSLRVHKSDDRRHRHSRVPRTDRGLRAVGCRSRPTEIDADSNPARRAPTRLRLGGVRRRRHSIGVLHSSSRRRRASRAETLARLLLEAWPGRIDLPQRNLRTPRSSFPSDRFRTPRSRFVARVPRRRRALRGTAFRSDSVRRANAHRPHRRGSTHARTTRPRSTRSDSFQSGASPDSRQAVLDDSRGGSIAIVRSAYAVVRFPLAFRLRRPRHIGQARSETPAMLAPPR